MFMTSNIKKIYKPFFFIMSIDKGKLANFNIGNLKTHYEINQRQRALKFKNG